MDRNRLILSKTTPENRFPWVGCVQGGPGWYINDCVAAIFGGMHRLLFLPLLILLGAAACKPSGTSTPTPVKPVGTVYPFYRGADISWITEMEDSGRVFYDKAGVQQDLFAILKAQGINAIRLRVWVNPAKRYNALADVIAKAQRVKAAGMDLMIDFHYSDDWADPGKQYKPAAWVGYSFPQLKAAVYDHTVAMLTALKQAGITVRWVQVGNEVADGMLWPDGKASTNMAQFAALVDTGYAAVKAVDTAQKVIVHVDNGYDNGRFRWLFDGLTGNGARFDIIGMSLYPPKGQGLAYADQCYANAADMLDRYGKPVMVVEIGMPASEAAECRSFIARLVKNMKALPKGQGQAVFYWEPQAYRWRNYGLGAWGDDGRPTQALDGFTD